MSDIVAPISIDVMLAAHEKQIEKDASKAVKLLVKIHDELFQNIYDTEIEESDECVTYTTQYRVDIKSYTFYENGKKLRILSINQVRHAVSQDMKELYDKSLRGVGGEASVSIDLNPIDLNPEEPYHIITSKVTLKKPKPFI